MPAAGHPLAALLRAAAAGQFPPADGVVRLLPAPPGMAGAVVSFTGMTVIAAGVEPAAVRAELASRDPFGGPMEPGFLVWLGERLGARPGDLDMVLAHPGRDAVTDAGPAEEPALRLRRRGDLTGHPRVRQAERQGRIGLMVYGEERGRAVATLGRAGRIELSVEIEPAHRGARLSRAVIAAARRLTPQDAPVFAQVSPGNASSVRAFWQAGFRPVGAEVLFVGGPGAAAG